MCPRQMTRRCPSAHRLGAGRLPGHALRFPRRGAVWPGGIADVAPHPRQHVHGVVYALSHEDLATLDGHEVSYRREVVVVELGAEALLVEATLYRVREPLGHFPPGRAYLETMLRGARDAGLPAEHLTELEAMLAAVEE
jgi:gamma-glutamylcyclotransferase (GGCT)/AIG2-like uncharacterized protein YtfP